MRRLAALARVAMVRPSPWRFVVAALGIAVVSTPAVPALGNVRVLALAGIVAVMVGIVVAVPGLPTFACALGIVETAVSAVDVGGFAVPVIEAVVLLAYLLVVDLAGRPGQMRVDVGRLASEQASVFSGGVALIAVVAVFGATHVTGSFVVAIVAIAVGAGAVAALRWMQSG